MKRLIVTAVLLALLCACTGRPHEPIIEIDMRAQITPVPAKETPNATEAPTKAPEDSATEALTQTAEEQTYAQRVTAAWEAAGLLESYAPYSGQDLLDLFGIELDACISGAGFAETEGYTNEIVLIEADEATAEEIRSLLSDHLDMLKIQFRSYDPAAYAVVEKAELLCENGVVLMIVSPEAEAFLNVFRSVSR